MEKSRSILKSGIIGAVLTLVSGLVNSTPGSLVGASWYGWPVTWVTKLVIAPQYFPWVVNWYGLVEDFIFWFVIAYIVGYMYCVLTMPKSDASAKTTANKVGAKAKGKR